MSNNIDVNVENSTTVKPANSDGQTDMLLSPRLALGESKWANIMPPPPIDGTLKKKLPLLSEKANPNSSKENKNSILTSKLDEGDDDIISFKPPPEIEDANVSYDPENDNPFRPRTQILSSPVDKGKGFDVKTNLAIYNDVFDARQEDPGDPLKPGSQLLHKPVPSATSDHRNDIFKEEEDDLFAIRAQSSSESYGSLCLEPQVQDENACAPQTARTQDAILVPDASSVCQNVSTADTTSLLDCDFDLFNPKSQITNSPVKGKDTGDDFDPFRPNIQLAVSPVAQHNSCTSLTDLPETASAVEPKLTNSGQCEVDSPLHLNSEPRDDRKLDKGLITEKAISSEQQLTNVFEKSPLCEVEEGTKVDNDCSEKNQDSIFLVAEGKVDPFRPKAQLMNSPAKIEETSVVDLHKSKTPSLAKDDIPEKIDTFKSNIQVPNSPSKENLGEIESSNMNTQHSNSPTKDESNGEMDHFNTKTQLPNSPAKDEISGEIDPFIMMTQHLNSLTKEENSRESKHLKMKLLQNSPTKVINPGEIYHIKPKTPLLNSPAKEENPGEMDPFKTKTQLPNSPIKEENLGEIGPLKTKTQLSNSPTKEEHPGEINPFKTKTQLPNSSTKDGNPGEMDPFKTKTQLPNSPIKGENLGEIGPFKTKTQLSNSPTKEENPGEIDPFKTKTQLPNSSTKDGNPGEMDPFKTKTRLPNSPIKEENLGEIGPFKIKTQLSNSPTKEENPGEINPFKTKTQLPNSSTKDGNHGEMAPFKTKTQLPNSPIKEEYLGEIGPFKIKTQLSNSPTKEENTGEIDPFPKKTQLPNSSTKDGNPGEMDPFKIKTQLPNSSTKEENLGEIVPFKSKTQLPNSLAQTNTRESEHFKPVTGLPNSPTKEDKTVEIDPLKPKTQLPNSPAKEDNPGEINPIKTKTQLLNSSTKDGNPVEIDPFKAKTQFPNSPTKQESLGEIGQFKTKTQLPNLPTKDGNLGEMDPFKHKTQLTNSSTKDGNPGKIDSFEPKTQLLNSLTATESEKSESKNRLGTKLPKFALQDAGLINANSHKACTVNSPPKNGNAVGEEHHLRSKMHLPNSSEVDAEDIDYIHLQTQCLCLPTKVDDTGETDAFKTEIQLPNSPAKDKNAWETDPFKSKVHLPSCPKVDPFKVPMSYHPVQLDESRNIDNSKPKSQLLLSLYNEQDHLRTQLLNSQTDSNASKSANYFSNLDNRVCEETDSFKLEAQLPSSVNEEDDLDIYPFRPKAKLAKSPATVTDDGKQDAVGSKVQILKLPKLGDNGEEDSLKPTKAGEIDPFKPKVRLSNSPTKVAGNEDFDPFKPTFKIASFTSKVEACKEGKKPDSNKCETEQSEKPLISTVSHLSENKKKPISVASRALEGPNLWEEFGALQPSNNQMFLASGADLGLSDNEFISGEQAFNDPSGWELLEQFGSKDTCGTDLRKCSLYVKFDPLVKPSLPKTPELMKAPTHAAPRRATVRISDQVNSSQFNSSVMNTTAEESICLMGTPPRVSRRRSVLTQRRFNASVAPTITEEEQVQPVDLLFSINGEVESDTHDKFLNDPEKQTSSASLVEIEEVAVYTESEWLHVQRTWGMKLQGELLAKERQYRAQLDENNERITQLEAQIKSLKEEKKEQISKVAVMKSVVAEYEKTLELMIASKEKHAAEAKVKIDAKQKELEQALQDAAALENSFSDLHRRYEKFKQMLDGFQKNEEALKETVKIWQDKLKTSEENLVKIKTKAEEKIVEVVASMEQKESEAKRMEAELKRLRLKLQSQETTLEQKMKENKELTEFCESLINQVGSGKK